MTTAADKAVRAQGGGLVTPLQIKALIVTAHRAYDAQAKIGMVDDGVDFDTWRRATIHDVVGAAASGSFRMVTQRDYVAVMAYFRELAGESGERRAESGEKRAESGEKRAESGERRAESGVANSLVSEISSSHSALRSSHSALCSPHSALCSSPSALSSPHSALCTSPSALRSSHSLREEDERRRALWSLGMAEDIHGAAFGGKEGARRYADAIFKNVHHTDRYQATARQVWAVIFTLRNRAASKRAKTGL